MARRPVLSGLEACADRAKRFARRPERRNPQKPGHVTFTLQPLHVPEITFPGSAHPTTVVTPDGKVLAELKPGEKAVFTGEVVEEAQPAPEMPELEPIPGEPMCQHCSLPMRVHSLGMVRPEGKPAVASWSRKS